MRLCAHRAVSLEVRAETPGALIPSTLHQTQQLCYSTIGSISLLFAGLQKGEGKGLTPALLVNGSEQAEGLNAA